MNEMNKSLNQGSFFAEQKSGAEACSDRGVREFKLDINSKFYIPSDVKQEWRLFSLVWQNEKTKDPLKTLSKNFLKQGINNLLVKLIFMLPFFLQCSTFSPPLTALHSTSHLF
ncbi:hypothetical protein CYJ36_02875 [Bacillus sp. UMB0893]|nr:hypothetical protein CYJ36_02875 [Bacillus sp. UMB0893]